MARVLLGTDLLIAILAGEVELETPLDQLALSLISLEWFLAELDGMEMEGHERQMLRTNMIAFRQRLLTGGGEVLGVSNEAIESWGRLQRTPLSSMDEDVDPLLPGELLVIATSDAAGLIYWTRSSSWAHNLTVAGVAHEIVE